MEKLETLYDHDDVENQGSNNNSQEAFVEFEKAKSCIETIITSSSSEDDLRGSDDALKDLRQIFDKYLELPSLLDRHVEYMVNRLAGSARLMMEDRDPSITFMETPFPRILSTLYALSKVRGRKRIQKLLTHQVKDVKAVLRTLKAMDEEIIRKNVAGNYSVVEDGGPRLWESIHTLWNWMGILGLVPFDCSVVIDDKEISGMVDLAKSHLSHSGPTRDMAAACLAAWLSRPDFQDSRLQDFQTWSKEVLLVYEAKKENIYVTMGVLQTVVTMLKVSTADRQVLMNTIKPLWSVVLSISGGNPSNILLRRYLVKWWTRVGMIYLPPRVLAWRYQLGRRSLNASLENTQNDAQNVEANSKNYENDDVGGDDFFFIPDRVEEVTGQVITSLTDPSTVVRWSAAKGVGRITGRLPAICAEDVVESLLGLFEDIEKDNNWHGACLALAELARRGLLLPGQLPLVIPKLVEAMHVCIYVVPCMNRCCCQPLTNVIARLVPSAFGCFSSTISHDERQVLVQMLEMLLAIHTGRLHGLILQTSYNRSLLTSVNP